MTAFPWLLLILVPALLAAAFVSQPGAALQEPHTSTAVTSPEAWDNVSLPSVVLPIVAGYGFAIFAVLWLPTWLGPEASIWAMLAALVLMTTWRWWSAHFVQLALQLLHPNCWATLAGVACLLCPLAHAVGFFEQAEGNACRVRTASSDVQTDERALHFSGDLTSFASSPIQALVKAVKKAEESCDEHCDSIGTELAYHTVRDDKGSPVLLHIYDVSHDEKIQTLNSVLSHRFSPLKFGGIFHIGIEVNGREWCYGYGDEGSGVSGLKPRRHPQHHYRETITLSSTQFSEEEVMCIIKDLAKDYQGKDYCLFRKNCCHFAEDLCKRLEVVGIPRWVHRLGRLGLRLSDGIRQVNEFWDGKAGPLSQCAKIAQL
jgi:hypothetical protein